MVERLFKENKAVNKGEEVLESLQETVCPNLSDVADDIWRQIEQNIILNAAQAAGLPERTFVVCNFKSGEEVFAVFYQVDGELKPWRQTDATTIAVLEHQFFPQAKATAEAITAAFGAASVPQPVYAMLQLEQATLAWFSRKITAEDPESRLDFAQLSSGWFELLSQEAPQRPLNSDRELPYFQLAGGAVDACR